MKRMIKKLTPEQEVLMITVRDEYINYFNSLEFDEEKCRKYIEKLYEIAKLKKPITVILDSPLALQFACNMWKGRQVRSQVENQVGDQVGNQVRNQVERQVERQVGNQVRDQVWDQVRDQVGNQVRRQVGNQVWDQVERQVGNQVWDQVWRQVRSQVENQVEDQVGRQVRSRMGGSRLTYFSEAYYGRCDDAIWISWCDYYARIGVYHHDLYLELKELFKCGIFTSIMQEGICYISRPPIFLKRDGLGNMHCVDDYAIYFRDGFGLHYLWGIYFSPTDFRKYIKGKKASAKDILSMENVEQKAALIKLYGYEKIIKKLPNVKCIDVYKKRSSITGKETVCEIFEFDFSDEIRVRILKVEDHSVHKITFLGIPRIKQTKKCLGALAWTFGLGKGEYTPVTET